MKFSGHFHQLPIDMTRRKKPEEDSAPLNRHPPLDQSRLFEQLGYHLRRADVLVAQCFHREVNQRLKLTAVEYSILALLRSNEDVTQKQVSQAINVAPSNLAVILDQLAARGLITRVRSPADGRAYHLEATAAGTKLEAEARQVILTFESKILGAWNPTARQQLIRLLSRLHGITSAS